jgi:hypothetical protein
MKLDAGALLAHLVTAVLALVVLTICAAIVWLCVMVWTAIL